MEKLSAVLIVILSTTPILGETVEFNVGDESFEIELVTIGSPGNTDDPRLEYVFDKWGRLSEPYLIGGVDYEYSITKFEMSCEGVKLVLDLNVADPLPQSFCNDDGAIGHYPEPINPTQAGEFVNWLNTSLGYPLAYDITTSASRWETEGNVRPLPVAEGTEPGTAVVDRVINVTQQLADVDNAGGLSAFGTMGQTGNITEWEEGFGWFRSGVHSHRVLDAAHASNSRIHSTLNTSAGFRVVAVTPVPEPSSSFLLAIALTKLGTLRRRRR